MGSSPSTWVPAAPALTVPLTVSTQITHTTYITQYDTTCYSNVRSKADMSQLNLTHGTDD